MTGKTNIYKAGGIIIQNRRLLVTRSKGKDYFIAPGGKLDGDETAKQSLVRELAEELSVVVDENDLEFFGTFHASATGQEDVMLQMDVFTVKKYKGELVPDNEIDEMRWITSQTTGIKLGSIFEHDVLPKLKATGLVE